MFFVNFSAYFANTHINNAMKKIVVFTVLALSLVAMSSCTVRKVTRVDPGQTIDLSGRWNDADARMTGEAMIAEALGGRWLNEFEQANARRQW
jgi:hypothetical protein